MNDIFTLFKNEIHLSDEEMLSCLLQYLDMELFENNELYEFLDEFKRSTPDSVLKRIRAFSSSSYQMDIKQINLRELMLN